jgi:type I restriction enzyme S subunit
MSPQDFLAHFHEIANAPGGVARLRELIRTLAIQGVLVTQQSSDGDARKFLSDLLEHKFASESNQRKRLTSVDEITAKLGESPGLPMNWVRVLFGDIMINRDGERVPVSRAERETRLGQYDYYGASGVIDKIDSFLFDKPLLLIGEDGANLLNRSTPIAFMARGKYWVNNHAHVLDGYNEDFLRYIELHINAITLEAYVTGTAQPKMNQAKMNSIPIALPPLAEQKRIVAKVEELMALCDALEAQQQERARLLPRLSRATHTRLTDSPTQPHLNSLFTDLASISPDDMRRTIRSLAVRGEILAQNNQDESALDWFRRLASNTNSLSIIEAPPFDGRDGWLWCRLGDVFEVAGGIQKTPDRTPRSNSFPYLGVGNVYRGRLDLSNVKEFELEPGELERRKLQTGDILVIEGNGSFTEIGRCARWNGEIENCIHQNHVIRCRPCDVAITDYVMLFLNSPIGMEIMQRLAITSSGLYTLSVGKIRQIEIPLPPLAEQRRIVAKVDDLLALVDTLEAQQQEKSRLAEAFAQTCVASFTNA